MARGRKRKSLPEGQQLITAFFSKGQTEARASSQADTTIEPADSNIRTEDEIVHEPLEEDNMVLDEVADSDVTAESVINLPFGHAAGDIAEVADNHLSDLESVNEPHSEGPEVDDMGEAADTDHLDAESVNDAQEVLDEDDAELIEDSEHSDDGIDDADASDGPARRKYTAPDASSHPPIHEISAIFDDLVSRMSDVLSEVQGQNLRVATMCSGTESPLLALEMIQSSISKRYGFSFFFKHVFSCEIEPFKQAYIERNFHPPLLFRDVCELGNSEAFVIFCESSGLHLKTLDLVTQLTAR